MYAVRIKIESDGDFGFDETEFLCEPDEERVFYFETRPEAADALVRSFKSLQASLRPCGRDYIKEFIDNFGDYIESIAKKVQTFRIEKNFGNQEILYELIEVEKVELQNKSHSYKEYWPLIIFDTNKPFNRQEWDAIMGNTPDIPGNEDVFELHKKRAMTDIMFFIGEFSVAYKDIFEKINPNDVHYVVEDIANSFYSKYRMDLPSTSAAFKSRVFDFTKQYIEQRF